jgi:hypothetical protein
MKEVSGILILVKNKTVLGDKDYDNQKIIDPIKNNDGKIVIPPCSNCKVQREYDKEAYKKNTLEIFFNKIKQFR